MSNLRTLPISPREIYTECYRFIRMIDRDRADEVPIISPFHPQWMCFTKALISYNHRNLKHQGWLDHYRSWKFRQLQSDWMYHFSGERIG